jgi:hypothetical protein
LSDGLNTVIILFNGISDAAAKSADAMEKATDLMLSSASTMAAAITANGDKIATSLAGVSLQARAATNNVRSLKEALDKAVSDKAAATLQLQLDALALASTSMEEKLISATGGAKKLGAEFASMGTTIAGANPHGAASGSGGDLSSQLANYAGGRP